MRVRPSELPTVLALSFAWLLVVSIGVAASSGLPSTLTMDPSSAGPGDTVEVTGLDFPALEVVNLRVVTGSGAVALAETVTADTGYFRETVTLPTGLQGGVWELRARAVDGSEASYRFDAAGDVVPSGPVVSDAATTESTGNSGTDIAFMLIIAVGLAAVSLGVLYVRREVSSDRQPGMGFGEDPIWGGGSSGGTPAELTAVDEPAWKAEQPTPEETAET